MPTRYYCQHCSATFCTGWVHGHIMDEDAFLAATALACSRCGTPHLVKHSCRADIRDVVYSQPGPVSAPSLDLAQETFESTRQCVEAEAEWAEVLLEFDLRPQRCGKAKMEGLAEPMMLDEVPCGGCGETGSLRKDWGEEDGCPVCWAAELVMLMSWIT